MNILRAPFQEIVDRFSRKFCVRYDILIALFLTHRPVVEKDKKKLSFLRRLKKFVFENSNQELIQFEWKL